MTRVWLFVVLGYLSGSVLFARVLAGLMGKDILTTSKDENPGTSNAFRYGGFACGAGTLLGDFIKGFLPVWLFLQGGDAFPRLALALVVAAPVVGHAFPGRQRHRGELRLPAGPPAGVAAPGPFHWLFSLFLPGGANLPPFPANHCGLSGGPHLYGAHRPAGGAAFGLLPHDLRGLPAAAHEQGAPRGHAGAAAVNKRRKKNYFGSVDLILRHRRRA